jgi:hypothetical protein
MPKAFGRILFKLLLLGGVLGLPMSEAQQKFGKQRSHQISSTHTFRCRLITTLSCS